MPMFGSSSPFDHDVEKATDEKNTNEDWALIMEICDNVGKIPNGAKECLRSIVKRLNNAVPNVAMQALVVLDACVNNCGKVFHLEVASRDFESEIKRQLGGKAHQKVAEKLKLLIKKWSEGEFKNDPQLSLLPSLYNQMKLEGIDFSSSEPPKKATVTFSTDPNVVVNQQEEDELAKAIELSLRDSHQSPASSARLYPTVRSSSPSGGGGGGRSAFTAPTTVSKEPAAASSSGGRKVRAVYDFEAAEDNELTFKEGELINVLDDSDPNWWKGSTNRGEGLFPANFVTADLTFEPERFKVPDKKAVQFNDVVEVKTVEVDNRPVEIDEEKMDRLLHLLNDADPTGDRPDADEILNLEDQCHAMGPLLDQELEKIDRKHATLTKLCQELMESLNMYHGLMRESPSVVAQPPPPAGPTSMPFVYGPQKMVPGPNYAVYNTPSSLPPAPPLQGHQPADAFRGPLPPQNQSYVQHPGAGPGIPYQQQQQIPVSHHGQQNHLAAHPGLQPGPMSLSQMDQQQMKQPLGSQSPEKRIGGGNLRYPSAVVSAPGMVPYGPHYVLGQPAPQMQAFHVQQQQFPHSGPPPNQSYLMHSQQQQQQHQQQHQQHQQQQPLL